MNKKLTLVLDERIIENAKIFAKNNNISLSKLMEGYLKSIVDKKTKDVEITPLVESLIGVVTLPTNFDVKDEYTKHLINNR